MFHGSLPPPQSLGIESLAQVQVVARVDLLTRSPEHASSLQAMFGVTPFRFCRGRETLHAFPRLPAVSAKHWLEAQGLAFVIDADGLAPGGPLTWVQGGLSR